MSGAWVGNIGYVGYYNRCLNQQELARLYVQPFQMFAPPVWRKYFVPGGAAPPPGNGKSETLAPGGG